MRPLPIALLCAALFASLARGQALALIRQRIVPAVMGSHASMPAR